MNDLPSRVISPLGPWEEQRQSTVESERVTQIIAVLKGVRLSAYDIAARTGLPLQYTHTTLFSLCKRRLVRRAGKRKAHRGRRRIQFWTVL
jgi:predicted Rossmann fold nucleotide-binding protein DprA/Smf involved in DNA uptake